MLFFFLKYRCLFCSAGGKVYGQNPHERSLSEARNRISVSGMSTAGREEEKDGCRQGAPISTV